MLCIIPFCPESPRWLCKEDRWDEALRIVSHVRMLPIDHPYVANELAEIRAEVEFEARTAGKNPTLKSAFKEMLRRGVRNRMAIALCLMM